MATIEKLAVLATFAEDLETARAALGSRRPAVRRHRLSLDEVVELLRRWGEDHELAPSRREWDARGRQTGWPSSGWINEKFGALAERRGIRKFIHARCDTCTCADGANHFIRAVEVPRPQWQTSVAEIEVVTAPPGRFFCDGCFDCDGRCPHGHSGEWVGPAGWTYALSLAGFDPRTGGDSSAKRSRRADFGRNRNMVTGGDLGAKRHGPGGGFV